MSQSLFCRAEATRNFRGGLAWRLEACERALSEGDETARLLLYIRVVVYIFGNIVLSLDSPHQERMMITAVISGVRSDRSPRKPINIGESRRLSSYSTE